MLFFLHNKILGSVLGFTVCIIFMLILAGCRDDFFVAGELSTATAVPATTVSKNIYPTTPTPTKQPPNPNKRPLPSDLIEKVWKLQSYKGADLKNTSAHVEIMFKADGMISGTVGCNAFWGGYTIGDTNTIRIDPITDPMCYNDSSSIYGYDLKAVRSYEIIGNTLKFKDYYEAIIFVFTFS